MLKHTDASNGSLVVALIYQSNTLDLDFDVLNQHIFAVDVSTLEVEGMVNCWVAMLDSWHTFDSDTFPKRSKACSLMVWHGTLPCQPWDSGTRRLGTSASSIFSEATVAHCMKTLLLDVAVDVVVAAADDGDDDDALDDEHE